MKRNLIDITFEKSQKSIPTSEIKHSEFKPKFFHPDRPKIYFMGNDQLFDNVNPNSIIWDDVEGGELNGRPE